MQEARSDPISSRRSVRRLPSAALRSVILELALGFASLWVPMTGAASQPRQPLRACEKIVASDGRSRFAGAQERFAESETARKPRRGESQGGDEQPECIVKYLRIPSTAGTRGSERSRFFHKI